MKLQILVFNAILPLAAAAFPPHAVANATSAIPPYHYLSEARPTSVLAAAGNPNLQQTYWQKCVCRGQKLTQACMSGESVAVQFVTPLYTRFDSTLEADLARWGYIERNEEAEKKYCDFFEMTLEGVLEGLELEGQNKCFWFQHNRGDTEPVKEGDGNWVPVKEQTYQVDGRTYRNTYAKAIMAANAEDGVIYFIDRKSAMSGAAEAWDVKDPPVDQLPKLRQMSDMAWGVWRRVHPDGEGLGNIKYFILNQVVNEETKGLIVEALKTYKPQEGQARVSELPEWPGVTWTIETPEGAAMLGSPNGIAIGYFLSQHKAQLGANKYVHQVQLYVETEGGFPYMVFHVNDAQVVFKSGVRSKHIQVQRGEQMLGDRKVRHRSDEGKEVRMEKIIKTNS